MPAVPTGNTFVTLSYIPTAIPRHCNFCRFWQADADGLFGVCLSDGFAAKVFAERDEGSPIKTAEDFECPYWEHCGE